MLNFFKNKLEQKSLAPLSNYTETLLFDVAGNFIGSNNFSDDAQISNNISAQTIINKQFAIISQTEFVVKHKTADGDKITEEKPFLDFLSWINNPNNYPSPHTKDHIVKYLMSAQYTNGIYGIVFVFEKSAGNKIGDFKYIFLPQTIELANSTEITRYRLQYKSKSYEFRLMTQYMNFAHETNDEVYILQFGGNYNDLTAQYESEFAAAINYIKLQNIVATFSLSFYANSCFPSQIVTVSYELPKDAIFGAKEKEEFDKAVKDIKSQMKAGKGTSAGTIMAASPNIRVTITPLNISANSVEVQNFDKMASEKIFSYVDGGSYSVFMGVDEYSGNTLIRLKNLYDAVLRTFNYMVIKPMNRSMRNIVRQLHPSVAVDEYYLTLDTSGVRIFQEAFIQLAIQLCQNNLYTINELRTMISQVVPEFRQFGEDPNLNVVNAELSGNNTKPAPTAIATK